MKISKKQYEGWTSPNKASYLSYKYGLPISIGGVLISAIALLLAISETNSPKSLPETISLAQQGNLSVEQKNDIFTMAQELRFNSDWIYNLIQWHNDEGLKPIGHIKTETLMKVLSESYDEATKYSYGEEKYIYQLALELSDLGIEVSSASQVELADFIKNSEYTLEDVYFLTEFMRWYTQYLVKENLTANELYSLGWTPFPNDIHSPAIPEKALYKRFNFDDDKKKSFGHYLGTID